MKRKFLNLVTLLSLLSCGAAAVLWVRSYGRYDVVARSAYSGLSTELISMRGRVILFHFNVYDTDPPDAEWGVTSYPRDVRMGRRLEAEFTHLGPHWWNRLGFVALFTNSHPMYKRLRVVCVPAWLLVLAFAAAPTAWLVRHLRARANAKQGLCPKCRYDLRGNASGVCPECGSPASVCSPG